MQIDSQVLTAGPAFQAHAVISSLPEASEIEVTQVAQRAMFAGAVALDAEAFGVAVTRRPGATLSNLTAHESSRLIDVLCHAKNSQHLCQEQESEFSVWVVSSDARDARPRALWFTMHKAPDASYHIRLSDV